jgi:arylsulfatase A-like enzyme
VVSDAPYGDRDWTQVEKNYAAMITPLDTDVGRIVELTRQLKIDKKTLIILTSDNGPWSGAPVERFRSSGPLRGHKRTLYEGGIRVPFIAHWPGVIPANRISHEVITFRDMLPTLAEIADAQVPEDIDGLSVWKAFRGQPLDQTHPYLYWDYGHCRSRYDQAVRLGTWKGIRHGMENEIQLYNLDSDVQEKFNVADQHPAIVKKIGEIMQTAAVHSERYPIGKIYQGKPIWRPTWTYE